MKMKKYISLVFAAVLLAACGDAPALKPEPKADFLSPDGKLRMEFSMTPVYRSVYIEGIGNLYEFDGGPLSGWMYSVNGVFPNVGCSGCDLHDGDVIAWRYTCELGGDIGGRNNYQ